MNFSDILGGLMNAGNWIETYLINGFMGNGFRAIMNLVNTYLAFKPLIELFAMLFGAFGAA